MGYRSKVPSTQFAYGLASTTRFANTLNGLEKLLFLHIQLLHSFITHFILFLHLFSLFIRNIFFSEKFTAQIRTKSQLIKIQKKKISEYSLLFWRFCAVKWIEPPPARYDSRAQTDRPNVAANCWCLLLMSASLFCRLLGWFVSVSCLAGSFTIY